MPPPVAPAPPATFDYCVLYSSSFLPTSSSSTLASINVKAQSDPKPRPRDGLLSQPSPYQSYPASHFFLGPPLLEQTIRRLGPALNFFVAHSSSTAASSFARPFPGAHCYHSVLSHPAHPEDAACHRSTSRSPPSVLTFVPLRGVSQDHRAGCVPPLVLSARPGTLNALLRNRLSGARPLLFSPPPPPQSPSSVATFLPSLPLNFFPIQASSLRNQNQFQLQDDEATLVILRNPLEFLMCPSIRSFQR